MSDFDLQWDDTAIGAKLTDATQSGLSAGAETLRNEAVLRTPLETGALQDSAGVDVGDGEASVYFGTDHAIVVHERLNVRHFVGQAKFLEKALTQEQDRILDAIGTEMQRVFDA